MSSLPKPWEPGFRRNDHSNAFLQSGIPSASVGGNSPIGSSPSAPTVPPRSVPSTLPSSIGGLSGGMYGGMGPFGGGLYGGGIYGRPFGFADSPFGGAGSANLTQMVESQLRPGFDSIYSIVQAFSSVSMMLESTYFALQNTVRAAVGMADQFTRIGTQLRSLLLAFPLLAWLRRYVKRILYWLGVIKVDPSKVWKAMQNQMLTSERQHDPLTGSQRHNASWPMLLFFAVAIGGPLLIWRLLRSIFNVQNTTTNLWSSGQAEHYLARGLYDFAASRDDELSFKAGDTLRVAPKDQQPNVNGWLLASFNQKIGLIPANHVNVLGRMFPSSANSSAAAAATTSTLSTDNVSVEKSNPDQDSEKKTVLENTLS